MIKNGHHISRWLWLDLNLRPWAYESPALTTELQSLKLPVNVNFIIIKKKLLF